MSRPRILIVDDDTAFAGKLADALRGLFAVEVCHSEPDFRAAYRPGRFDLLIMDMRLEKDYEGLRLLREALDADSLQAAIVMTAYADVETYTDALEAGALTYLDKKEFSPSLIGRTVEAIIEQARMRRKVRELEDRLRGAEPLEIIGGSSAMRRLREATLEAADRDAPVMIVGEPGSGRELAARNIHRIHRMRRDRAFTLYPFGRTASWDALGDSASDSGVLFVRRVEDLDGVSWSEVLDRLRKAADRPSSTPQIVLSCTPGSLRACEMRDAIGAFRIETPPLREHSEDIALLAQHALQGLHRQGRTRARSLRSPAIRLLEQMPWPGNVRELHCAVALAASRADAAGRSEIAPEDFPFAGSGLAGVSVRPGQVEDYKLHLVRSELALIEAAIETFDETRKTELAEKLGYNDRYVFMRRLRKNFEQYPNLRGEFPQAAELADDRSRGGAR